jgi:hypothetical protein
VATIAAVVKVAKRTIYKIRLNLDIWGEPYASCRGLRSTKSSTTLPKNGNAYGRGVKLFAD